MRTTPSPWALRAACALLLAVGFACVARSPRSHAPTPGAPTILTGPPLTFPEDRCGSGSLAAVLGALGDSASEGALAAELPTVPGGVLSVDLVLAARRRGFEAGLHRGDQASLRAEIEAGRPAILMLRLLNAPGRGRDIYHYVVADGYDRARALFRIQLGDGKARWVRLEDLETSWKPAGFALLRVARPPPGPSEALRRGVLLESDGRAAEAADVYRRALLDHPGSVRLRVNLGNALATLGRRTEAEESFRAALALDASDPDALNNLAWLLLEEAGGLAEAESLARRAASARSPDRAQALETLGRVLVARGRCQDAATAFDEGLVATPRPGALRAALLEGIGRARLQCGDRTGAQRAFEAALAAEPPAATAQACREALRALSGPPR